MIPIAGTLDVDPVGNNEVAHEGIFIHLGGHVTLAHGVKMRSVWLIMVLAGRRRCCSCKCRVWYKKNYILLSVSRRLCKRNSILKDLVTVWSQKVLVKFWTTEVVQFSILMFFFCWIQWCGTKSHLSSCQANKIKMKKNHLVKPPERFPDGNFFTCMASFKWVQKIQSTIQSNVYVHLHFPTLLNLGGIWGTHI